MTAADRDAPHLSPATLSPQGAFETAMAALSRMPGEIGWMGYRKLKRRIGNRTLADFDRIVERLGPGDIAIDLGANAGEITRRLADTGAEVHAFEPDPDTFARLRENVGTFGNVILHNKAAGAEAGTVPIFRPASWYEGREASASKAVSVQRDSRTEGFVPAGTVEMIDFGAFLNDLPRPAALVKVDIEGSEWTLLDRVLAEARDRFDAMFVETHERFDRSVLPRLKRMQRDFASWDRPYVNLYWG
jgi:FkbM family methyltransferase